MPAVANAGVAPNVVLQTDPEHVKEAVSRLRNAFARPERRQSNGTRTGEQRRVERIWINAPVRMASVVMAEGAAKVLDDGGWGEAIDLSEQGLSLSHPDLFMHYFSLVTFTLPSSESISLLIEILWTIRESKEEYRSGSRFVGVIEPAL